MITNGKRKTRGKERLQRVIDLCRSVEKGVDPFIINIDDVITVVREYFPDWELPEELCLDAEAIHQLSSVIELQSDWVKHRSTSLYTDPFLIEKKIQLLSSEEIVTLFLKAWEPIVELEQISFHSLTQSLHYWKDLLPLSERWQMIPPLKVDTGATTREELIKQRIFAEKTFSDKLEAFWIELKKKVNEESRIRYWDFIGADTYLKTIERAYMTSFLVTYGYATLEIFQLEEEIFIKSFKKQKSLLGKKQKKSVPISVNIEDWRKWRESKQE